jgi:Flp pilus assembly protein TadD
MDDAELKRSLESAGNHLLAGRSSDAQAIYRSILADHPNHPDALNLLAITLAEAGQFAEALQAMRKAVAASPTPRFQNNLGVMLMRMDDLQEAIDVFHRALAQDPNYADAHNNLANALIKNRQLNDAIASLQRAVELRPDYFQAYSNLGYALSMERRFPEAILACRKSLALRPDNPRAHTNLAVALEGDGQLDAAIAASQKALEIQPNLPEVYLTLSKALSEKGQVHEAIAATRKAISLRPDFASAHFNLSTLLLSLGDFREGWREHEYRVSAEHLQLVPREFARPRWDGSDLAGRKILLDCEQGFGDAIQFVRYVPLVAQRGGNVLLECRPELARLFRSVAGIKQFITLGQNFPEYDVHYPLLSLPMLFDTTPATIPAAVPYLAPDPVDVQRWRGRIAEHQTSFKVGLVWRGKKVPEPDRTVPFDRIVPLARVPGIKFFSLQKRDADDAPPSANFQLIDWTDDLHDFADTAALLANLDLLITIDTSVAHLAGALGLPTWVLLRFDPDWRWLRDRADSPWYPTMRLFRQPQRGDWETPIRRIEEQLRSLTSQRA